MTFLYVLETIFPLNYHFYTPVFIYQVKDVLVNGPDTFNG